MNYSNVTIRIAHINTSHKLGKHMTILVIQLNEPWKRVSVEVLGKDRLGGKRHLIKKGMAKRNIQLIYLHPSQIRSKSFLQIVLKDICITLTITVIKVV